MDEKRKKDRQLVAAALLLRDYCCSRDCGKECIFTLYHDEPKLPCALASDYCPSCWLKVRDGYLEELIREVTQ